MAIGLLTKGSARVEVHDGMVAAWVPDGDDACGLVMPPDTALHTAVKILGCIHQITGDHGPVLPVGSVSIDHRQLDDGQDIVRLTFAVDGTPIAAFCDLTQFAEMAAAFAAASRAIDKPGR